ncbi:5'-3' exoribonuclease 1-like [Artemia franciscana]|uniref:5'-3' exoribonuclease 1-like n=1 Tax=Artemia franciscana TaxID=6661 RepID=UPI0032DAC922
MNGIIHNCSHPNDEDVHFRITEEKIFSDIFHYLEVLFRMIRPSKLFFMAVDGVAPRAKMNQQRGRRFRSAKEAILREEEAKRKGEALPEEERFDSNCITPGTEFMVKLQEQLKYFVTKKISTDPLWQNCRVILSGHETPGEGEHKIMEYIRFTKSQPGYDPNTRHCLYGLDADLMMLGLSSHEPYFSLLREEVRFGKKEQNKKASSPEETTFHLLHLSLMRDYLDLEFSPLKDSLPFEYDLERIIDDWILMGFLVGNDFIPNLPHFHIAKGTLPVLYKAYMSILPTLEGYINEDGKLNMKRFCKFMEKLESIDHDNFQDIYDDLKFLAGKRANAEEQVGERSEEFLDFLKKKEAENREFLSSEDEESEKDPVDDFNAEFRRHKTEYYEEKMDGDGGDLYLKDQAENYVRAIQWNLAYYYDGVSSWSWYFPHHYAPYVSDVKAFEELKLTFELGKPFLPYQQLLGVLPAASKKLLPEAFQYLMTSPQSSILDFYPTDFETDLNGKKQDWEAVVLIPFIEEEKLIKAMEEREHLLTDEEKKRNSHGPMHVYVYDPANLGRYDAPKYFSPVMNNHARRTDVYREELAIEPSKIQRGLCPGVNLSLHVQGFPILKHLQFKSYLKHAKVKVFQQPSMGENMILELLEKKRFTDLKALAEKLIDSVIFIEWPHLTEAKVAALADRSIHFAKDPTGQIISTPMSDDLQQAWEFQEKTIQEHCLNRLGIKIGDTDVLIYARKLCGRSYVVGNAGLVTLEKEWAKDITPVALQTTLKKEDISVAEEGSPKFKTLDELFPVGSSCFIMTKDFYGAPARVLEHLENEKGKIRVEMGNHPLPRFKKDWENEDYAKGFVLARELGISSHLLSRLTGTVYIVTGNQKKINVGLNLKNNKLQEEVPGWTRKIDGDWRYSYATQGAIEDMIIKFPEFIDHVGNNCGADIYKANEIFPDNTEEKTKKLTQWVANLPCNKIERQACGTPCLSATAVKNIEEAVTELHAHGRVISRSKSKVKPKILYKPSVQYQGCALPDPTTEFQLYDRVINVRDGFSVPQGALGTVVGIQNAGKKISDMVIEVVFDKAFPDGTSLRGCTPGKGYRMPSYALIDISHGHRFFSSLEGRETQPASHPIGLSIAKPARNRAYANIPPPTSLMEQDNRKQSRGSFHNKFGPYEQGYQETEKRKEMWIQKGQYGNFSRSGGSELREKANQRYEAVQQRTTVSSTEAAKSLSSPMKFVKSQEMSSKAVTTEEMTKLLRDTLKIGVENQPVAVQEPKSITFEALAAGTMNPSHSTNQSPAKIKAPRSDPESTCLKLIDLCGRKGFGLPVYCYSRNKSGQVQASVTIGGKRFFGVFAENEPFAAGSAAEIALEKVFPASHTHLNMPHMQIANVPRHGWGAMPYRQPVPFYRPYGPFRPSHVRHPPPPIFMGAPKHPQNLVPSQVERPRPRAQSSVEREADTVVLLKPRTETLPAPRPSRNSNQEPKKQRKVNLAPRFSNV